MTTSSSSSSIPSDGHLGDNAAKTMLKDIDEAWSPKGIDDTGATTAEGGATPVALTEPSRPGSPHISDTLEGAAAREPAAEPVEATVTDSLSLPGKIEAEAEKVTEETVADPHVTGSHESLTDPAKEEGVEGAEEQQPAEVAEGEQAPAEVAEGEQAPAELAEGEQAPAEVAEGEQEAVPEQPPNQEAPADIEKTTRAEPGVSGERDQDSNAKDEIEDAGQKATTSEELTAVDSAESCPEKKEETACTESSTTTVEDAPQKSVCAQPQGADTAIPSPLPTLEESLPVEEQAAASKAEEHLLSPQETYGAARAKAHVGTVQGTVEILPLTLPCVMNPKEYLQEGLRVPYDAPPPSHCPAAAPSPLDYATLRSYVSVSAPPTAPGAPVGPPLWHPTLTTTPTRVIDLPGEPGHTESPKKGSVESVAGSPVVRGFGCCGGRKRETAPLKPASDAPEALTETQRALSLDQRLQGSFSYNQATAACASSETSGRFYPHPPPAAIYSRYYYVPSRSGTEAGGAPVYRVHGPYSAALVSASGVLSETQQDMEAEGAAFGSRPFDGGRSPTLYPQVAYSAPGQGAPTAIWPAVPEGYTPMDAENFAPASPAPSTTGVPRLPRDDEAHDTLSDQGATVVTATFPADQTSDKSPTHASDSASTGAPRKPVQKRLGTMFGQWLTASFGCCGTTRERPATETPCQQPPTPFYMERQPSGCSVPASHRSFSYYQNGAETTSIRRLDSQISAATSAVKVYPAGQTTAERICFAMPDTAYPVMQQLR